MLKPFDFKPEEPNQTLATIAELKAWMLKNGCNFQLCQIDSIPIPEGFILKKKNNIFTWSFTERGTEYIEKSFDSEMAAVAHAYQQIKGDGWARSCMIGFVKTKADLQYLKETLQVWKISFSMVSYPMEGKMICDIESGIWTRCPCSQRPL